MRSLFLTLLFVLTSIPLWAKANQCDLCIVLQTKQKEVKEAGKIKDEMERVKIQSHAIVEASNAIDAKIRGPGKTTAYETDAILKFMVATKEEDDLMATIGIVYPDYHARQKFYDARINLLDKSSKETIRAKIKEFETFLKKGNG